LALPVEAYFSNEHVLKTTWNPMQLCRKSGLSSMTARFYVKHSFEEHDNMWHKGSKPFACHFLDIELGALR